MPGLPHGEENHEDLSPTCSLEVIDWDRTDWSEAADGEFKSQGTTENTCRIVVSQDGSAPSGLNSENSGNDNVSRLVSSDNVSRLVSSPRLSPRGMNELCVSPLQNELCVAPKQSDNTQSLVLPLNLPEATRQTRFASDNSPRDCSPMCDSIPMSMMNTSKPFSAMRSTFTLPNQQVLRGTTPSVLLEGFGWRIRSTAGGIGAEAAENEYHKSFPVPFVDMFLSHSWHARWYLKFVTLLLYFNAAAAVSFAMFTGVSIHCLSQVLLYTDFANNTQFKDFFVEEETDLSKTRVVCLPCGAFVFFVVLFNWHHVMKTCPCRRKVMFLDKVCIHQTDPKQKELGIKSIGGILFRSDSVLIAWDTTYFERLWCVYELAAFKSCHPDGKIVFLPVMLGGMVAVLSACTLFTECLGAVVLKMDEVKGHSTYKKIVWSFFSLLLFLAVSRFRVYGRELGLLNDQLAQFSVHRSRCFCCENNHIHPITKAELPCDRELVYASIAHWHGRGSEHKGLAKFDRLVQQNLRVDVEKSLGGWALVPYELALSFSIWDALIWLDTIEVMKLDVYTKILMVMSRLLSSTPIILATGVGAGMLVPLSPTYNIRGSPWTSFVKEQVINLVLTAFVVLSSSAHSYIRDEMCLSGYLWQKIFITVIEITLPILFFTQAGSRIILKIAHYFRCIDAPQMPRRSTVLNDVPICSSEGSVELARFCTNS